MKPNLVKTMALGCALSLLPGCGWIGIGVAADELTDDPDDPIPTLGVLGSAGPVDEQPFADRTLLAFAFTPNDTATVRLRFEVRAGRGEWTTLPASFVALRAQDGTLSSFDADQAGNLLLPIKDTSFRLVEFNHAALLGRPEIAGVSLRLVFGDAGQTPDNQPVTGALVDILEDASIGRELGELVESELQLRRGASNDPESDFRLDTVLLDHGGDRDTNEFQIEYAVTNATPTEGDFRPIPDTAWDRDNAATAFEVDGRARFAMQFRINPIASGAISRGGYERFWMRIRHREIYPTGRRGENPTSEWSPWISRALTGNPARVGHTPRIERAAITDPSLGDPGRRWPRLPITLTVSNPSPQFAMEVELAGSYRVNSGKNWRTITPFFNGNPRSRTRFRLEPGERTTRYLVWNCVLDEGLGNRLIVDPPYNDLRVAEVRVHASALAATGLPLATPLTGTQPAGFASLSTSPFVGFRDNLLPAAKRVWSAGAGDGAQGTRDLFFTQLFEPPASNASQEWIVGLNQQFEAIQLIPQPASYNFNTQNGENNGVYDIAPIDFDRQSPDCLVWVNGKLYYLDWPAGGAPTATFLGSGGGLRTRGVEPVSFELRDAAGVTYQTAVFFTWQTTNGPLEVSLRGVIRDPNGTWANFQLRADSFPLAPTTNPGAPRIVGGEFDGDPDTYEIVLGAFGTEEGQGMLHYWSLDLNGTTLTASAPEPLPLMPDTLAATQEYGQWRMRAWQPDATSPTELVVLREMRNSDDEKLERLDVQRLRRVGNAFANAWETVDPAFDSNTFPDLADCKLQKFFTQDLDGASSGRPGSDLVVVLDQVIDNDEFRRSIDLWTLATDSEGPAWRRLAADIRALTPDSLTPPQGGNSGSMVGGKFQLIDVDGDGRLDLVTGESIGNLLSDGHFNYFAASLGGVAGRLGDVPLSAGAATTRAVLPGLVDANGDGQDDVIAGTRLHLADVNGSYVPTLAGLSGGPQARHRVERVLLDRPANAIGDVVDVLVAGAHGPVIRVDRLEGIGTPAQSRLIPTYQIPFGPEPVFDARAFMTPDAEQRRIKDILALVGTPPIGELQYARFDAVNATTTRITVLNQVLLETGFALLRRGVLSPDDLLANDLLVQDVAALTADRKLIRFDSDTLYQEFDLLEVPAGERILAITSASIDGDGREDLLLMTEESIAPTKIFRLRVFLQGNGELASTLLARFEEPFSEAGTVVRAFRFDRTKPTFAEGFLLLDDTAPMIDRSEIILIRPFEDPVTGELRVRLARSPQDQAADLPMEVVVTDNDQDGIIEVIGGEIGGTTGLKRLVTNSESIGGN
ncbi:MAG: VCBS repeat-containing protein [bacterium]|nr:VCBS repeat-containing protein [bacterium]